MPTRLALVANLAVKAALLLLLGAAVAFPDSPQFEGKAMTGRALTYPLAAVIVPVAWWAVRRRRGRPVAYPYALDVLLVLPFLIDVAGNALDLYDTVSANHFVSWGLLTAAFGQLLLLLRLRPFEVAALAVGFGATTAIVWELLEYVTFVRGGPEEATAYTDTLRDLSLGLSGAAVAAVATALLAPRD